LSVHGSSTGFFKFYGTLFTGAAPVKKIVALSGKARRGGLFGFFTRFFS
jgi:hypothetical protein